MHFLKIKRENITMLGEGGDIFKEADLQRRWFGERDNIHPEQSKDNYALTTDGISTYRNRIEQAIEVHNQNGRKLKDDAVLAMGCVITLPQEYKGKLTAEQERLFFMYAEQSVLKHFGITQDKILQDVVHKDETTPHLHIKVLPIDKNGRFNAKDIFTPAKFKTLHNTIDQELKTKLDFYNGGLVLDETDRLAKRYDLSTKELKQYPLSKAKKAVDYALIKNKVEKGKEIIKQSEIAFIRLTKARENIESVNTQIEQKQATLNELEGKVKKLTYNEQTNAKENYWKTRYMQYYVMPIVSKELGEQKTQDILKTAKDNFDKKYPSEEKGMSWIRWCRQEISGFVYRIFHPQPKKETTYQKEKTEEKDKGMSF